MGVTVRRPTATIARNMKLAVVLSLAVFACASSVEKRDADPEPGYGYHHVPSYHHKVYHAPSYHYKPSYHPKAYHPKPHPYKYPVHSYAIHHHGKRSADPEPESEAASNLVKRDADPEPGYGHHPVYHAPSYHYKPSYHPKAYHPKPHPYKYPVHSYAIHHHGKRSADPEPEPEASYGKSPY